MFEPSDTPRLFALPPGCDFPRHLVTGLIARMADTPPEAMARVTLYVNTRRMQRRVREVFDTQGARLLPRLRLITDLGSEPLPGLPPAIPPLRRRLELAQLVARLVEQQTDFAPGTAVYDLADSLAKLMDEMQGEGVPPEALDTPALAENHAAHWERSLRFIRLVSHYFAPDAPPDAETRQRKVVETLIARWQASPPTDPVIVAGSTGSRGTTALFMQAVARLPQGALVLPGFDFDMPEPLWGSLGRGHVPAEDHPQYRFCRLMRDLGLGPADVHKWDEASAHCPARNKLISLALRPAPVTDQWMTDGPNLKDLSTGCADMTLIEAPDPRAEATAIALILRHAAETGQRAALISPDRMLTRRVAAALDQWGILPDDSAGQPLALSAPGRFLRHIAGLFGRKPALDVLLTLLKHPLTATGADRGTHLRWTRELELHLRRHGPAFPDAGALIDWAGHNADQVAWATWIGNWLSGIEDMPGKPLTDWVALHLDLAERIAAGPSGDRQTSELWKEAAGREAQRAMGELAREAPYGGTYAAAEYADLLGALLQAGSSRDARTVHPTIAIWGTLEARVQGADLVIMGSLNEGTWPEAPDPDPWLSRQMRLKAGLLLPERQIGLAAHDFQQAIAASSVVMSRARRDTEAETVPSRWLNRLTNLLDGLPGLGGPDLLQQMRDRGDGWLNLARALETPTPVDPAPRPAPRPPVATRPRKLPVTDIARLIRDPYAIYARRILRLRPLDPLRPQADARERGNVLHRIVEAFVKSHPEAETDDQARTRLMQIADQILTQEIPWPSARRLWRARLNRIAGTFVRAEAQRLALGMPLLLEEPGHIPLTGVAFTLTARPDRIDQLVDGQVHIFDYKSGAPPSEKQMKIFDKQLLLEAAMAERGAFATLGPRKVEGVTYIRLGGAGEEKTYDLADNLAGQTWDGLVRLITRYLTQEQGYVARRAMFETKFPGDYDHLARFGEWEMQDPPKPEDVG